MEKKFEVFYYNKLPLGKMEVSHKYTEAWEKTDFYCPNCGKRGVWSVAGGDMYVGPQHICVDCESSFYLPDGVLDIRNNNQDSQRLKHLKA